MNAAGGLQAQKQRSKRGPADAELAAEKKKKARKEAKKQRKKNR
jgi:signal recognition particle subunit SRP54